MAKDKSKAALGKLNIHQLNAAGIHAGSVDAEKITGTTISGKTITGSLIKSSHIKTKVTARHLAEDIYLYNTTHLAYRERSILIDITDDDYVDDDILIYDVTSASPNWSIKLRYKDDIYRHTESLLSFSNPIPTITVIGEIALLNPYDKDVKLKKGVRVHCSDFRYGDVHFSTMLPYSTVPNSDLVIDYGELKSEDNSKDYNRHIDYIREDDNDNKITINYGDIVYIRDSTNNDSCKDGEIYWRHGDSEDINLKDVDFQEKDGDVSLWILYEPHDYSLIIPFRETISFYEKIPDKLIPNIHTRSMNGHPSPFHLSLYLKFGKSINDFHGNFRVSTQNVHVIFNNIPEPFDEDMEDMIMYGEFLTF